MAKQTSSYRCWCNTFFRLYFGYAYGKEVFESKDLLNKIFLMPIERGHSILYLRNKRYDKKKFFSIIMGF